jgi:hypothetical protein
MGSSHGKLRSSVYFAGPCGAMRAGPNPDPVSPAPEGLFRVRYSEICSPISIT